MTSIVTSLVTRELGSYALLASKRHITSVQASNQLLGWLVNPIAYIKPLHGYTETVWAIFGDMSTQYTGMTEN